MSKIVVKIVEEANKKLSDAQNNFIIAEDQLKQDKKKLESKGIKYDYAAKYTDGNKYDLKLIVNALDPSFNYCSFDEYENNSYTGEYCKLKNQVKEYKNYIDSGQAQNDEEYEIEKLKNDKEFEKTNNKAGNVKYFMIGGFIIFTTCSFCGVFYLSTKRREIIAYGAQQVMPVAQEGIEKMHLRLVKQEQLLRRKWHLYMVRLLKK